MCCQDLFKSYHILYFVNEHVLNKVFERQIKCDALTLRHISYILGKLRRWMCRDSFLEKALISNSSL